MRVERGRIRDLARAVHTQDESYFAEADGPAPATILSGIARLSEYPGADPLLPGDLDLTRVLAAGAGFRYPDGPLREGERLQGRARISAIYEKKGSRGVMTFVEQTTTLTTSTGTVRGEYVALMIEMPRPEKEES